MFLKIVQSHVQGAAKVSSPLTASTISRRALVRSATLGVVGGLLNVPAFSQVWGTLQFQRSYPSLKSILRDIMAYYKVLPGTKTYPKYIREAIVNHYLYRQLADHLKFSYYEPPAGLVGLGYFGNLIKMIKKQYGDNILLFDGHLNSDDQDDYARFTNVADQVLLIFREIDDTYVALVNPEGVVESDKLNRAWGVTDMFSHEDTVLIEFGTMRRFFDLGQAKLEKNIEELEKLTSWYIRQYPRYKDWKYVIVPGHGGFSDPPSYYVTPEGTHKSGITMPWPESLKSGSPVNNSADVTG